MRKLHIAISTDKIEDSINDYSGRLGVKPCVVVPGEYALWRTEILNLSIRHDENAAETLRHLGWEDPNASEFSEEPDVNGIVWETFTAEQQAKEINEFWPATKYIPN